MDNVIRAIPVRDGNGDELTLYEYQQVGSHLATTSPERPGGTKRLALDTGEAVRCIDDDNFAIAATGEKLTRIR